MCLLEESGLILDDGKSTGGFDFPLKTILISND
jgi:hypothetical protein